MVMGKGGYLGKYCLGTWFEPTGYFKKMMRVSVHPVSKLFIPHFTVITSNLGLIFNAFLYLSAAHFGVKSVFDLGEVLDGVCEGLDL